jgi:hypothetical protein
MPLVFAGIFTDALSGAVTLLIGISGPIGGGAHYAAVLARKTEQEIERATAFGLRRLRTWSSASHCLQSQWQQ